MRVGLPRATRVSARRTGRLTQWLATLLAIGGSTADISALEPRCQERSDSGYFQQMRTYAAMFVWDRSAVLTAMFSAVCFRSSRY